MNGRFVVEPHVEGGFWIGDDSGQYVRVLPQPGFEDDDAIRCQRIAELLTKYGADQSAT